MGLADDIKYIKEHLEKQEKEDNGRKERKFRFPFSKRVSTVKRRKNFVVVILINDNLDISFKKLRIEEQTIMHEMIPRLATAGHILYYKRSPVIILPSWSVEPISPRQHFEDSLKNGSNTKGYAILLNRMKKEQVQQKAALGGSVKWIVLALLALVVGYALVTGGGA